MKAKTTIKRMRAIRRKRVANKIKEFSFIAKFEINSEKDIEDVVEYLRDMYKDYKFKSLMLKFVFDKEKRGFEKEVIECWRD